MRSESRVCLDREGTDDIGQFLDPGPVVQLDFQRSIRIMNARENADIELRKAFLGCAQVVKGRVSVPELQAPVTEPDLLQDKRSLSVICRALMR